MKRRPITSPTFLSILAKVVQIVVFTREKWWPGTESNCRHGDFQSLDGHALLVFMRLLTAFNSTKKHILDGKDRQPRRQVFTTPNNHRN